MKKLNRSLIRVPLSEKIMFTKHMSMMVRSGMSEIESIKLIQRQVESKGFSIILADVIAGLENGQFLSAALRPFERVFGGLFISIIGLGETSGTLSENLSFLAQELKESKQLRSKVKSALIYPIIILIATIGVVSGLVLFVLPKILPIFSSLGAELPLATRILIASSDFLREYFFLLLGGGVALVIIFMVLLRIKSIKYFFHRMLLYMPFAGNISKKIQHGKYHKDFGNTS